MIRIVGATQKDKEVLLYYTYQKGDHNFFKVVFSKTGFDFQGQSKYVIVSDEKQREERNYDWKDFRIAKLKDVYYLTYGTDLKGSSNLLSATSTDLVRWIKGTKIEGIKEAGSVVSDFKYKNKYVMYYGDKSIYIAYSGDLKVWKPQEKPVLTAESGSFDDGELSVGNVFERNNQLLLIYYIKKNIGKSVKYFVGACAFNKKDPSVLLWKNEQPIWEQPDDFYASNISPVGNVIFQNELIMYWLVGNTTLFAVSCQIPGKSVGLKDKIFETLKRFEKNPIITPRPDRPWESRATFNSAAVYEDGKVHFLYRALGDSDLSVVGYASSEDGFNIDYRCEEPAYIPRESWETPGGNQFKTFAAHFASGGGYGGIEDPKVTRIDNRFYMTYVAFDGANPPRAALTSIDADDFLNQRWDKWETPHLISAPGMVNKSATLFPEKISGKYVMLHRVYPNILIDFVDDLNFGKGKYLRGQYFIPPRKKYWDSKKLSAGAPPIKTKDGWLLIYHAVGHQDPGRYKIGAMMLDKNDPRKVLYRSNRPIIAPDASYENQGHKSGIVYPCGAVVKDGKLLVYYGGADTVVCGASEDLDKFLFDLKGSQEPKLRHVRSAFVN